MRLTVVIWENLFEALHSDQNIGNHEHYRNLILATQGHFGKSHTDEVIAWFVDNPDIYSQAISKVYSWDSDPGEVNMEEFAQWTQSRFTKIDPSKVAWSQVFVELFL